MPQKQDDQPVTTNGLIKWGGIIAGISTTLVSLVWFCASVKSDVAILKDHEDQLRRDIDERKAFVDRRLAEIDVRANATDKTLADVQRKLDVAVALLERIDKQLTTTGK